MPAFKNTMLLVCSLWISADVFSQVDQEDSDCRQPATVILFRTFNFFSFKFSYKLFAGDSLLGRIKTHDVMVLNTYAPKISLQAATKAPSANASRKSNYQKRKAIVYPFSLQAGQVYFVKCDFLNERLFEYPRQPTIRLIKKDEVARYLRKRFLKRKLKIYLYTKWLKENGLVKLH